MRFRLNTYKQFKTLKDHQLSELLSKLKRGKLTPQEIEAGLERAKKNRRKGTSPSFSTNPPKSQSNGNSRNRRPPRK